MQVSFIFCGLLIILGYAVAWLVEALRYKPEGCGSVPDGVMGIFH